MREELVLDIKTNIGEATKETKKLNEEIKKLPRTAKGASNEVKGIGDSFKTIAKASGIVFLLDKAFRLFKETLGKNQVVVDFFSTAMNSLSIAFSDLFGFIEDNVGPVVGYFKDLFENPAEKIQELGTAITEGLYNRFIELLDVFGLVGKSLVLLVSGQFSEAFDTIKQAGKEVVDVYTGVDESFDDVSKAIVDYTTKTIKQGKAITETSKAAERSAVMLAKLNNEFEANALKQEEIIENELLSFDDRFEALIELTRLTEENNKAQITSQEIKVKAAQDAFNLNDSEANFIKLQQEKNALAKITASNLATENNLFEHRINLNDQLNENEQENLKDQKKIDDALLDSKLSMVKGIGSAVGALGSLFEKGTAAAKAAALAQIAIDTGVGFAQGLNIAQKASIAAGPGAAFAFPIFYATQIAAVLAAASKAKSIMGAGGGVTPPPPGTTNSTPAPQMMSGAFDISGGVAPEPVQAFVLTDSMTNSQNQLANIRRRATI